MVFSAKVRIRCEVDLLWTLLVDWMEHPTLYDSNVAYMTCHERDADTKKAVYRTLALKDPKTCILHRTVVTPLGDTPRAEPKGANPDAPASEDALRELFDSLDANGNGVLEREELKRLNEDAELRGSLSEEGKECFSLLLAATETPESTEALFEELDSDEVFGGRKDGFLSWIEFRAFFLPQAPEKGGSIAFELEKMGPVPDEMTPCKGVLLHKIRDIDQGITELTISCEATTMTPPSLGAWAKSYVTFFKKVAENIKFLCPKLKKDWEKYSIALHHRILSQAKRFHLISPVLARSPSAMGHYMRSPTPGLNDGFSVPPFDQMRPTTAP